MPIQMFDDMPSAKNPAGTPNTARNKMATNEVKKNGMGVRVSGGMEIK